MSAKFWHDRYLEVARRNLELIAINKELVMALKFTPEWIDSPGGGNSRCPICNGYKYEDGHKDNCARVTLIKQVNP